MSKTGRDVSKWLLKLLPCKKVAFSMYELVRMIIVLLPRNQQDAICTKSNRITEKHAKAQRRISLMQLSECVSHAVV